MPDTASTLSTERVIILEQKRTVTVPTWMILETKEDRLVLPLTCFSIEPGIYLKEFGIRSEINVFINANLEVNVTGGVQTEVTPVLSQY